MAYEPTEWKTGDIVTSDKLNKVERGIKDGGPLIITVTKTSQQGDDGRPVYVYSVDRTKDEIVTAIDNGRQVEMLLLVAEGPASGKLLKLPLVRFLRSRGESGKIDGDVTGCIDFFAAAFWSNGVECTSVQLNIDDLSVEVYEKTITTDPTT